MSKVAANIIDAMDSFGGSQAWQKDFDQKLAQAKEHAPLPLPELISFAQLCKTDIPRPNPIIYGLFEEASSMVVGGGSKTFKSWAMSDLAVAIVHGVPWWGFGTERGVVIYCNFELKPYYCRKRFLDICKAKNVSYPETLYVWNLRGAKVKLHEFRTRLLEDIERYKATCVFVDPFYKLLGEKDERISAELMPILEIFEEINSLTQASTVCAAHYTKGNQAAKDPLDRISGGAALNRHPDCLITLTRHETEEAFTVDIISRDFPPVSPFVVRWTHPILALDQNLDPTKLKIPKGRPSEHCAQEIIDVLRLRDDQLSTVELQKLLAEETGMSSGTFYNLWAELKNDQLVFKSKITGKWNLKT